MLSGKFSLALVSIFTASAAVSATTTYKVGTLTMRGTPKEICVIQGSWPDGQAFRYEAWDRCPKMHIAVTSRDKVLAMQNIGRRRLARVSSIPASAAMLDLNNGISRVLLYRGADGEMQEILIGD